MLSRGEFQALGCTRASAQPRPDAREHLQQSAPLLPEPPPSSELRSFSLPLLPQAPSLALVCVLVAPRLYPVTERVRRGIKSFFLEQGGPSASVAGCQLTQAFISCPRSLWGFHIFPGSGLWFNRQLFGAFSYLTWHRVPFSRKSNNLRAGRKYPWVLYFPLRCCRFALPFPALIPSFLRFQALRARPSASHTQRLSECDAAPPQLPKETKILAVVLLALGSQPAGQPLLH